jgi:hypothetical protein
MPGGAAAAGAVQCAVVQCDRVEDVCMRVTTVVQFVPPCGVSCVCPFYQSALLSSAIFKNVCCQPAPGGGRE